MKTKYYPQNIQKVAYMDSNGNPRTTRPSSALTQMTILTYSKMYHDRIKEETLIPAAYFFNVVLDVALKQIKNKGQIVDFYNELFVIEQQCGKTRNKFRFNELIAKKACNKIPNVTKEWLEFVKSKPRLSLK